MRWLAILLLALQLFVRAAAAEDAEQGADQLKRVGEEPLAVTLLKEGSEDIEFSEERTPIPQTLRASEIQWILRSDAPPALVRAVDFMDRGAWLRAFQELAGAKKAGAKTKEGWLDVHLAYYLPLCTYHIAEEDEKNRSKAAESAIKGFAEFIEKNQASWLARRAYFYQGRALLLQGKFKEAEDSFKALGQSKDAGYQSLGRYGLALTRRAQKQTDAAMSELAGLLAGRNPPAEAVALAMQILLEEKKDYKEAAALADKLKGSRDRSLLQRAYELSGCAAFYMGRHREALEDLLRADLLYSSASMPASERVVLCTALAIKGLTLKAPKEYQEWEYQPLLQKYVQRLPPAQRQAVAAFKP